MREFQKCERNQNPMRAFKRQRYMGKRRRPDKSKWLSYFAVTSCVFFKSLHQVGLKTGAKYPKDFLQYSLTP